MNRFIQILLITFLIAILFPSCSQKMDRENKEAASEGLRNSEIKRVSEAEIIAEGFKRGRYIADTAQLLLGKTLKRTLSNQGVEAALEYCNVSAYPLLETLSEKQGATIKRVSLRLRNLNDAPDEMEQRILEAYQYSMDQGQEIKENVQLIDNDYLLYNKPIMMADPLCTQCHGKVGDEVLESTYNVIKRLYPDDNATGHTIGELRGMWSIKISKSAIVKDL